MLPSVPIATDNIYKFATLFGLVLFISTYFLMIYFISIQYQFSAQNAVEYETLNAKEKPSQDESIRKKCLNNH